MNEEFKPSVSNTEKMTRYWMGDTLVSKEAAAHYREEYGDYWLPAKRKERRLFMEMVQARQNGQSHDFGLLKLWTFQALVEFEIRFGEDWPPLCEAIEGITTTFERAGFSQAMKRLLPEEERLDALAAKRFSDHTTRSVRIEGETTAGTPEVSDGP